MCKIHPDFPVHVLLELPLGFATDPAMAGLTLPSMYTLDGLGQEIPVGDRHSGDGECRVSFHDSGACMVEEAKA